MIDSPAFNPTLHPEACGVAYLVRESDRGWLATVFSNRIATVATRTGVDPGTLLGLVTAHEIGHLLLGAGYHGWTGVMQADCRTHCSKMSGGNSRASECVDGGAYRQHIGILQTCTLKGTALHARSPNR